MSTNNTNNEMNALATLHTCESLTFKSAKLNEATAAINAELTVLHNTVFPIKEQYEAAKANFDRKASDILANVVKDKSYKDDGFKSAAEYAMETFGFGRSKAYQLARVGERCKAIPDLKKLTVANADKLAGADGLAVKKALESGEIDEHTTQSELEEFATNHPKFASKPKVVPTFDLFGANSDKPFVTNVTRDEFEDAVNTDDTHFRVVSIPKTDFFVAADITTGKARIFLSKPHVKPKTTTKSDSASDFLSQLKAKYGEAAAIEMLKAALDERGKTADGE